MCQHWRGRWLVGLKALEPRPEEERALATAALALRCGERTDGQPPAPIAVEQLAEARRPEDLVRRLWMSFQRITENVTQGGRPTGTPQGRRMMTRLVTSIDRSVSLNRDEIRDLCRTNPPASTA